MTDEERELIVVGFIHTKVKYLVEDAFNAHIDKMSLYAINGLSFKAIPKVIKDISQHEINVYITPSWRDNITSIRIEIHTPGKVSIGGNVEIQNWHANIGCLTNFIQQKLTFLRQRYFSEM